MFLGPVRGIMVKIFLQILGYELRLRLRLVTKLSGWEDEDWELAVEAGISHLERHVPPRYVQHRPHSTPALLSRCPQGISS